MGQVLHGSARATEAVRRAIQHSQASIRVLAERHGKGVALAKGALAEADLKSGRLVRLFAGQTEAPIDFAYYPVGPQRKLALPKMRAFVDWLRQEAGAMDRAA